MEEQAAAAKAASVAPPGPEDDLPFGDHGHGDTIPESVGKVLTHSCRAIFEIIDAGLLDSDGMVEASANTKVFTMEQLCGNGFEYDVFTHWSTSGPILFQSPEKACELQACPSWWDTCSKQLESKCVASIPETETPSSYAACSVLLVMGSIGRRGLIVIQQRDESVIL